MKRAAARWASTPPESTDELHVKTSKPENYLMDVATVMTMRLTSLPMMWMFNPLKAEKETRKMFSEKEDALLEMQKQLMQAPALFWYDMWTGMLSGDNDAGWQRAQRKAENRLTRPYTSRVSANRRRLAKGN